MQNYTILLIDYEPRSIERFRDPLVGAGYAVEIATDGLSGIEAFQRLNPDMVLVEAMIPKKHGFEVCQELKRTPHGRRTPVLITTSVYKGRKYRTQALHIYGCDEYIEKPIAPEQLLEIVGKFLGPGASTPPGPTTDSASASPEGGAGKKAKGHGAANARAVASRESQAQKPPRSSPTAQLSQDDGEAEIMARLDAILPAGATAPARIDHAPLAVAETLDLATGTSDEDPLAQIRAELDAELNAVFGTVEPAKRLESIPSDHEVAPSVLEVLPPPDPAGTAGSDAAHWSVASGWTDAAQPSAPPARAQTSKPNVALPQSRPVEAQPTETTSRSRARGWMWAAALVAASLSVYLLFMFLAKDGKRDGAPPSPATPPLTAQAKGTPANEPPKAPEEDEKKLVLNAVSGMNPEPKKPEEIVHAPEPVAQHAPALGPRTSPRALTVPSPATKAPAPTAPAPARPAPQSSAPSPVPPAPTTHPRVEKSPVPTGIDDNVSGVESVPDSAAAIAPPTTAPGMLIPIDEADALPVSISRTPPVYPAQAQSAGLSGTVIMNVLVNEHGTVDQVVLVSGISGGGLNESAMRAAKSWTYRPATKRGVPVKVWKSEQVVFSH